MIRFVIYTKAERGLFSLQALIARGLVPTLCVSEDGERQTLALCDQHKVPHLIDKAPKTAAHIARVHDSKPDLLVCAGYSKILPGALFEPLPMGGVNCHGGKLPEYRGASPIPWQILRGETSGAAYVLRMTPGIDDGPVLASEPYTIEAGDTARSVTDKVTSIFSRIVPDVVQKYADGQPPKGTPQDESGACHWTRRTPADGEIDWAGSTAKQVADLVRALDDPYPGAFVTHGGKQLIIKRARPYHRPMRGIPGRCVGRTAEGTLVIASDGAVEILAYERDGQAASGREFPVKYGDTFPRPQGAS
jgi:methionyl-tRNA formyltransferase